eukprot:SAG11_NODE_391_length_9839_cov_4.875257_5_plen_177_part_00
MRGANGTKEPLLNTLLKKRIEAPRRFGRTAYYFFLVPSRFVRHAGAINSASNPPRALFLFIQKAISTLLAPWHSIGTFVALIGLRLLHRRVKVRQGGLVHVMRVVVRAVCLCGPTAIQQKHSIAMDRENLIREQNDHRQAEQLSASESHAPHVEKRVALPRLATHRRSRRSPNFPA